MCGKAGPRVRARAVTGKKDESAGLGVLGFTVEA